MTDLTFLDYDEDGNEVHECWQCGGDGAIAGCFEDCCCGVDCDPESVEYCCAPSRCDVCGGKGNYTVEQPSLSATDKGSNDV